MNATIDIVLMMFYDLIRSMHFYVVIYNITPAYVIPVDKTLE